MLVWLAADAWKLQVTDFPLWMNKGAAALRAALHFNRGQHVLAACDGSLGLVMALRHRMTLSCVGLCLSAI
ncbi:hypothetical protein D1821_00165 [Phaeobacter inhibens]|nr:hypothetical protein D1821_00165 [Phaeobacter inhibens]